jgi:hypothetical protein
MILEAFSKILHEERRRTGDSAKTILHRWLLGILTEAIPEDNVGRVIHAEIALLHVSGKTAFASRSQTGETLLNSLYLYCESYERWQFGRWLHELKPHYFNELSR